MIDALEYSKRAREYFTNGYNCSQAVAGAFADLMDVDLATVVRMASSFGGGMGRMRLVCGCVSGMYMVLGYLYGYDDPKEYDNKSLLYKRVQDLAASFKEDNGSIICAELLGQEGADKGHAPSKRDQAYYKKRPCPELVEYSARLLADYINDHPYK